MKKKVTVTFNENGEPRVNGKRTTPHYDGNNGRSVYFCGEYVIKVNDRGYAHDDMRVWKSIKPKDRQYFVPTLAQGETDGYRWSIQPYVELDDNFTEEADDIVIELVNKYGLNDIDYLHGTYSGPRNWAMHNGQPVIFDYGL